MTKKFAALCLATAVMSTAFVGCAAEAEPTTETTQTEAPATEEATEAEATEASTETAEATDADTAASSTETGADGVVVNTYIAENGNIDSISAASTNMYYEESSLTGEALMTSIANREGAVAIATTNPDGTPNIATTIPGVASDKHLSFGIVPNQTTNNLFGNKIAVMSYYVYEAQEEDKFERNKGARLVLQLVEDEATIKELREANPDTTSDTTIFTEIVKVLPLG